MSSRKAGYGQARGRWLGEHQQELDIISGMTILLPTGAGGYEREFGWTGSQRQPCDRR